MDDSSTMSPLAAKAIAILWPIAPALAGALVSVAIAPPMTVRGHFIAVFVGLASAIFIAPALIDTAKMWWDVLPISFERAIVFIVGATAMGGLPLFVKWMHGFWGDPLGMLAKVRNGYSQKESAE